MSVWSVVDVLLLLGCTLRLTRLVITDDPGEWLQRRAAGQAETAGGRRRALIWSKASEGLGCPWCVGFWIGVLVLVTLALEGGPGEASVWWRYVAGAFTLNWIAAQIGSRLDG